MMELVNIILSEVSQLRRPKIVCLPPYLDFRSGKGSNVVGLGSHTKGRAHMGGMGIGRKPKT
jgi:hypothetical protein